MAFVRVMDAADVIEGRPSLAVIGDTEVAIFRVGDTVFAIDDVCSHAEASLVEGEQFQYVVECPRHGGRFDIRTGKAIHFPAFSPVRTFPVKIDQNAVFIDVEE